MISLLAERHLLPSSLSSPGDGLAWARYLALHEAIRLPLLGLHRLAFAVTGRGTERARPARNAELERVVRARYRELLTRDFDNAKRGVYPMDLLFDMPFSAYARSLPRFLLDTPSVLSRLRSGDYKDLPGQVDLESYPAYYRRTFHWQTDGYFSRHSAQIYDLAVELLFVGVADVMRRQALAEIMGRKPPGKVRLLDVGTGTGRFLRQAARSLPGSELCGLELSPWYASYASEAAAKDVASQKVHIEVGNAEAMPYADGSFDVVSSVFMLHELPRKVRRNVLGEIRRVLTPGGLLVIEDAAQPSESLAIAPALSQFSKDMHEPFFADYLKDDLASLLLETGFRVQNVSPHFVSKVVSATS